MPRGSADKVLFRRQRRFESVNVSLVVVKVLVARGVGVLQLLRADHGRADGSVPGPVELPQVNLGAERRLTSTVTVSTRLLASLCACQQRLNRQLKVWNATTTLLLLSTLHVHAGDIKYMTEI